jgi:hypothetical protein
MAEPTVRGHGFNPGGRPLRADSHADQARSAVWKLSVGTICSSSPRSRPTRNPRAGDPQQLLNERCGVNGTYPTRERPQQQRQPATAAPTVEPDAPGHASTRCWHPPRSSALTRIQLDAA